MTLATLLAPGPARNLKPQSSGPRPRVARAVFQPSRRSCAGGGGTQTCTLRSPSFSSPRVIRDFTQRPGDWIVDHALADVGSVENAQTMNESLHRFANVGVSVAIDDFGTGYASIA